MPGARLSKDDYFLIMARLAGLRGTCVRRTVGCILVSDEYHVLSTGYNGVPSGEAHCIDHPCAGAYDPPGDTTRCRAVHAERNAVDQLISRGEERSATRAYVTTTPCPLCAEYMMLYLPRLREVHALSVYAMSSVEGLRRHGVEVQVHEMLRTDEILRDISSGRFR